MQHNLTQVKKPWVDNVAVGLQHRLFFESTPPVICNMSVDGFYRIIKYSNMKDEPSPGFPKCNLT